MSLGKQHTILYPQDKSYSYKYPTSNGTMATETYVNNAIASEIAKIAPTYYILSSDFVSTDNTKKDVSEFQFTCYAGKLYELEILSSYTTNLATMGCSVGVRMSSGTGSIHGFIEIAQTTAPTAGNISQPIYAISDVATLTGASITGANAIINVKQVIIGSLLFKCLTDGRFTMTFGNETTGTATVTLKADSMLKVKEVS